MDNITGVIIYLLNSYDRIPATNNLTDISEADFTKLSSSAIQTLAEYSNRSYKEADDI
jgi:hypothetical protein